MQSTLPDVDPSTTTTETVTTTETPSPRTRPQRPVLTLDERRVDVPATTATPSPTQTKDVSASSLQQSASPNQEAKAEAEALMAQIKKDNHLIVRFLDAFEKEYKANKITEEKRSKGEQWWEETMATVKETQHKLRDIAKKNPSIETPQMKEAYGKTYWKQPITTLFPEETTTTSISGSFEEEGEEEATFSLSSQELSAAEDDFESPRNEPVNIGTSGSSASQSPASPHLQEEPRVELVLEPDVQQTVLKQASAPPLGDPDDSDDETDDDERPTIRDADPDFKSPKQTPDDEEEGVSPKPDIIDPTLMKFTEEVSRGDASRVQDMNIPNSVQDHYNQTHRPRTDGGLPTIYPARMEQQLVKTLDPPKPDPTFPSITYSESDSYKKKYIQLGLRIDTYEKIIRKERALILLNNSIQKALIAGDYNLIKKIKAMIQVVKIGDQIRKSSDNLKTAQMLSAVEINNFEMDMVPRLIDKSQLDDVLKGIPHVKEVTTIEEKPTDKSFVDYIMPQIPGPPAAPSHISYSPSHLRHDLAQWEQMKETTFPQSFEHTELEGIGYKVPDNLFPNQSRAQRIRGEDEIYGTNVVTQPNRIVHTPTSGDLDAYRNMLMDPNNITPLATKETDAAQFPEKSPSLLSSTVKSAFEVGRTIRQKTLDFANWTFWGGSPENN